MGELVQRLGRARLAWLVLAVVGVVAAGILVLANSRGDGVAPRAPGTGTAETAAATSIPRPTATPEVSPNSIAHPGILDGMPLNDAEWEARKDLLPLAVMIDNTTGAYPHAGLDKADLVYEAFVEGGITRLMAVYWRQDAEKILPVRSARTPFVIWASELGAPYGHAGGAGTENDANALGQIVEWGVRDLNAFSPVASDHYFRDGERDGPYDLETSTASLARGFCQAGVCGASNRGVLEVPRARDSIAKGQPGGRHRSRFPRPALPLAVHPVEVGRSGPAVSALPVRGPSPRCGLETAVGLRDRDSDGGALPGGR